MRARHTGTAASLSNGCLNIAPAGYGRPAMAASWAPDLDILAIEARADRARARKARRKQVTLPTLKFLEKTP